MDFIAVATNMSKLYRDLYLKAHETFIDEWAKAEQRVADSTKFVWWKK
jgi:hypothetical protein